MSPHAFDPNLFDPCMPEVETPPNLAVTFDSARKAASEDLMPARGKNRHVVIVTPGRMLMLQPCPAPGKLNHTAVESVEKIMSSKTRRNVAVIAYTEQTALQTDLAKTIPFFGLLVGLSYIGHSVWVFEGHPSALTAGCREADLLLADGEMVPFLQSGWIEVAAAAMRRPLIFSYERATRELHKLYPPPQ